MFTKYPDHCNLISHSSTAFLFSLYFFSVCLFAFLVSLLLYIISKITDTYCTRSRVRNLPIVPYPLSMGLFYCGTLHILSFWENFFYSRQIVGTHSWQSHIIPKNIKKKITGVITRFSNQLRSKVLIHGNTVIADLQLWGKDSIYHWFLQGWRLQNKNIIDNIEN